MAKGSEFERETCKALGRWWCGRDDVFWRSSISGGRATVRGKTKKTTVGQHGDIAATDPIGNPLLDLITFELKRGYPRANYHDWLDASAASAANPFSKFISQAKTAHQKGGSAYWALIHRRDRRESWIYFPNELFALLRQIGAFDSMPDMFIRLKNHSEQIVGCPLISFFACVTRPQILLLVKGV